jgi:hypothetical protein
MSKNKIIQVNNGIGLEGVYKLTVSNIVTSYQKKLLAKIESLRKQNLDYFPFVRELNLNCSSRIYTFLNIIPTVARTMIADNLTNGTPDNEMVIEYIALGTGSTAVNNTDVKLVTETYRNSVASKTNSNNIAYISGFFSATECNGTYKEAGIFCNATGIADSGILLSRVLLNDPTGIAKSNTETLTLDWVLTIQ